jgi:ParB family chromosome partitioning protein
MSKQILLPVADVIVGQNYSREELGDITSLKQSIESHGLQQPIIVDVKNNLVAGFRRFECVRQLGHETIMAVVTEADNVTVNFIENLERENLTFYEECVAIRNLFEGCTDVEVALALGRSTGWSRPRNKLWTLPPEIIELVRQGKVNSHKVNMLVNSKDKPALAERILEGKDVQVRHRPKKSHLKQMITICMERDQVDAMNALRYVIGDITEEEFWDLIGKES